MVKIGLLKDRHSPPARVARVRKTYTAGGTIQKTIIIRQERPR